MNSQTILELIRQGATVEVYEDRVVVTNGASGPPGVPKTLPKRVPRMFPDSREKLSRRTRLDLGALREEILSIMEIGRIYQTKEVITLVGQDPDNASDYQRIVGCLKHLEGDNRIEYANNEGKRGLAWIRRRAKTK